MTRPRTVIWPRAATGEITVPAAGGWVRLAGSPVSVGAPPGTASAQQRLDVVGARRVRVQVMPRPADAVRPVLVRVRGGAGPVALRVHYADFADAFGGAWSDRLTLVSIPECALTTPADPACAERTLATVHDRAARTVTAQIDTSTSLVALTSTSTSDGGDLAATPLSASSTWTGGSGAGDFTWSYPLRVPPGLGGPMPSVGLAYSSGAVDGATSAANNQPSWVGEGFSLDIESISRTYRSCTEDGQGTVGDRCWGGDNATLSMKGRAGELIQVSTSPDVWRLSHDDGSRIQRFTNTVNGDNRNEYWVLTTIDGTRYYFGLNRLPGWTASSPDTTSTQSTWTVPVFGDDAGEPCHGSTFATSWCQRAYQWNLDYVVDRHGNSMSVWYSPEGNHYARANTASSVSPYTRGGTIARIDYGTRQDNGVDTEFTSGPTARVVFGTDDRCITLGSTCTPSNTANWPDVPWDRQCDSTTSCPGIYSPAFFTQKMLSTITTQVRDGSGYQNVESWQLKHVFKDPGDGNAKILWLAALGHTGLVNGSLTVPDVTFNPIQMNNRVDISGTRDPIIRYRMSSLVDEAGREISITYTPQECAAPGNLPASPSTNGKRCFPVIYPDSTGAMVTEYFHKYVVSDVTVRDLTGGGLAQQTHYAYLDAPMWHYDDGEFVPVNRKTWGQWRGYSKVRSTVGSGASTQQTDVVFFRGMNGDKLPTGTRSVSIAADPDFGGTAIPDEPWRAGATRETIVYNGTGSGAPVVTKKLLEPWEHGPTATRNRNGVTVNAYATGTKSATTLIALDGGRGWRTTKMSTTYDYDVGLATAVGRVVSANNQGDLATTADDTCLRLTYAENTATWLLDRVVEAEVVGVDCATTPDRPVDTISDIRTRYDGATTFGTTVGKGDTTYVERLADFSAGTPVYQQVSRAAYDAYGRAVQEWDAADHLTTSAFTPATGGPVTAVTTTNTRGWTSNMTVEPAWGSARITTDPNGRKTEVTYDPLGRVSAMWNSDRDRATQTATRKFTYLIRNTGGPTAVSTKVLTPDGTGYIESWELYDGLLRPRQSQTPAPGGGRVITDTLYDAAGRAIQANAPYYDPGAPGSDLFTPTGAVPGRTQTTYDGAGRVTATAFQVYGVERTRMSYAYGGDRVDTTPPSGGTATSAYSDVQGHTVQLRQYHGSTVTGSYDTTSYAYTHGNLTRVTTPGGAVSTYAYDLLGRKTSETTPDRGTTTYTYDASDNLATSTDSRNVTLTYGYDDLNRPTAVMQGSKQLAGWTYDTLADGTVVRGQLASSTSFAGGSPYTITVDGYDAAYQQTGSTMIIPSTEGALAGRYSSTTTYAANGAVATMTMPYNDAVTGGLSPEKLTYGYDSLGELTTLTGLSTYITGTGYDSLGRMTSQTLSTGGKTLTTLSAFEDGTGRLLESAALDEAAGQVFRDLNYAYDPVGKITSIRNLTAQYGGPSDDNQCFAYDYLQRLTAAWTPGNGDCTATKSVAALGGPAPYWQSWTHDVSGNRLTQVDHRSAGDATRTSTYPAPTAAHPHAVTSVTTTAPGAADRQDTFGYDAAGNETSVTLAGQPQQTITWGAQGRVGSVAGAAGTNSYIYSADGARIMAKDPGGTTLYVGSAEYRLSNGTVTVTRMYDGVAARTAAGGVSFLLADQQGTGSVALRASDLAPARRYTTPYGEQRGGAVSWPTSHGFVNGVADPTGLVHLGAREYDPANGRFISADPITDTGSPQQLNGYAYADNDPVSSSDADGRLRSGHPCPDGDCSVPSAAPILESVPKDVHDLNNHVIKRERVAFYNRDGILQAEYSCWSEGQGPPSTAWCNESNITVNLGKITNCVGDTKVLCYIGGDGHVHDIYGNVSCQPAGFIGPQSTTCGGSAGGAGGTNHPTRPNPRSCVPPPRITGGVVTTEGDDEDCRGLCALASWVGYGSFAVGVFGPWCPHCDLISTGLGLAAAGLYAAAGDSSRAKSQLAATVLGVAVGSAVGRGLAPVARETRSWTQADKTMESVLTTHYAVLVGTPFCGYTAFGCDGGFSLGQYHNTPGSFQEMYLPPLPVSREDFLKAFGSNYTFFSG